MPLGFFKKKKKKDEGEGSSSPPAAASTAGKRQRGRTYETKSALAAAGGALPTDTSSTPTRAETKKERKAREKAEKKAAKASKKKRSGVATASADSSTGGTTMAPLASAATASSVSGSGGSVKKGRFTVSPVGGTGESATLDSSATPGDSSAAAARSGGASASSSGGSGSGKSGKSGAKGSRTSGNTRVLIEVMLPTSEMKEAGTYTEDDIIHSELPLVRSVVDTEKKKQIVRRKLRMCCVSFDFEKATTSQRLGIEKKRQMLAEVIEYISSNSWWDPLMLSELLTCMRYNLFRPLPTNTGKMKRVKGDEEEEPFEDPQWPHLELTYELCLRFLISGDIDKLNMQQQLEGAFLHRLIKLFETEDRRERDYLKTILHRIYGRFMALREGIKRDIANEFFEYSYGTSRTANGIAEFLDIFSSIINGFTVPVKTNHTDFLKTVLMPLHKCKRFDMYFQQLADCCVLFVNKEPKSSKIIVNGLVKFWPLLSPTKQALYLRELIAVLGALVEHPSGFDYTQYRDICKLGVEKMLSALSSDHFQVVDTALTLWKDTVMITISDAEGEAVLKRLCHLLNGCLTHWNEGIRYTADDILTYYAGHNHDIWDRLLRDYPVVLLDPDDTVPSDAAGREVMRVPKVTPLLLGKEDESALKSSKSDRRRKWEQIRKQADGASSEGGSKEGSSSTGVSTKKEAPQTAATVTTDEVSGESGL